MNANGAQSFVSAPTHALEEAWKKHTLAWSSKLKHARHFSMIYSIVWIHAGKLCIVPVWPAQLLTKLTHFRTIDTTGTVLWSVEASSSSMAFEVAMATETSRHVQAHLIARSECLRDMLRRTYAHSSFYHSFACNETFSRPSVVACSDTSGKAGMREYSSASVLSAAIITAFQWACMKAHSNTISAVLRVIISVPVVHSTHFKKP